MVLEGENNNSNSDFDNKKKIKKCLESSRAVVGMLMVQVFGTGLQLLSRVILSQGTFIFALLAYRNVVGALTVAPFAFFFERGKGKELGWVVAFWLFMNALTGVIMAMGLFYYGLRDTTATYATNFLNLIPIATFVFSTIIGIEKLRLGTKGGKVKTMGAIVCLAGALTITLYKGRAFHVLHHGAHQPNHVIIQNNKHNWTRGTIFLVCSIVSYAMWFIVQAKLFKAFPYKYWAIMLTCTIASVQATVIGLCLDRKKSSWRLDWNLQLLTIFYSGILATGASYVLICWAVANRGPTYPSMFNPLALIFVAITEAFFLGEAVTVGSLVGMSLIIVGLYLFLWGKNKELKSMAMTKSAASEESIVATDQSAGTPSANIAMSTATPTDSDGRVENGHENKGKWLV